MGAILHRHHAVVPLFHGRLELLNLPLTRLALSFQLVIECSELCLQQVNQLVVNVDTLLKQFVVVLQLTLWKLTALRVQLVVVIFHCLDEVKDATAMTMQRIG